MKHCLWFAVFACTMFALTACRPDDVALSQTVEREVAAIVATTIRAQPVSTALPTATRFATGTPLPTHTPAATGTSYPTATFAPTATAFPTYTPSPVPTETSTPTPPPTRVSVPVPPPPSGPTQTQLINAILAARDHMRSMAQAAGAGWRQAAAINCTQFVADYTALQNAPSFSTDGLPADFSAAHSLYREAVTVVIDPTSKTAAVGTQCREHIEAGTPNVSFNPTFMGDVHMELTRLEGKFGEALYLTGGQ